VRVDDREARADLADLLDQARLHRVGLAALDAHDFRPVQGELDAVHAFETGEIEHAALRERLAREVGGDLQDAAQVRALGGEARLEVGRLIVRVDAVGEADGVRGRRAVPVDDRLLAAAQLFAIHAPPQAVTLTQTFVDAISVWNMFMARTTYSTRLPAAAGSAPPESWRCGRAPPGLRVR